jgi:hypothetical protein
MAKMDVSDVECKPVAEMDEYSPRDSGTLRLDSQGFPLRPQPSDDPLGEDTALF